MRFRNALGAASLMLVCATTAICQTTYHVNGACGDDAWSGLSEVCQAPDGPKATIQAALDAALDGDTVLVGDGLYTGAGNRELKFGGRDIILRSVGGAAQCIIDCEGQATGFTFFGDETRNAIVEGFTVTGGRPFFGGGAMQFSHIASPTIRDCVITGNEADEGGALYLDTSASPRIERCRLEGNAAGRGGAIRIFGEGISSAEIVNCLITGNEASGSGGGVYTEGPSPVFVNCLITGNTAAADGGGLYAISSDAKIINCAFSGNSAVRGGAVAATGGWSVPEITGSILWNSAAAGGDELALLQTAFRGDITVRIARSVLQGGPAGVLVEGGAVLDIGDGLLDADPLYADPAAGDYRLLAGSPAIDAGDNTALPSTVTTDLDGHARFVDDPAAPDVGMPGGIGGDLLVDIGPYERQIDSCYADCDSSGSLDFFDFLCFQNLFAAGDPGADCDGNGVLDIFDFLCFQNAFAAGCP